MQLYSENIRLYGRSRVTVQNAFFFANDTIALYNGAEIDSTVKNDCAADKNEKMYQCMNFDLNQNTPLSFDYILENYNK